MLGILEWVKEIPPLASLSVYLGFTAVSFAWGYRLSKNPMIAFLLSAQIHFLNLTFALSTWLVNTGELFPVWISIAYLIVGIGVLIWRSLFATPKKENL